MKRLYSVILALGLAALVSCDSNDTKKASHPAAQAMAPSVAPPTAEPADTKPLPALPVKAQASTPAAQKPDPVAAIIAEAEKAYVSGEENFAAGKLDDAKQELTRALEILTQLQVDIKSDERLQQEFEKISDAINLLGSDTAPKEAEGLPAQQPVPAPIDEANQVEPSADPNVKAKAEAELRHIQSDLPLMMNDYVAGYINYFSTHGRAVFEGAFTRSGRYRDMILRIFREEGIPQDLIYLAQAESGFKPQALSRARARGMWQFMSSRGVGYGLRRTWWVDDRQDPEKSTRAAARHLKDLYNQFGDWYLAMAAYNSGPGNVQQAVRRTGYADFWELYKRNVLPAETKNYVPIILAMTIMSKNPAQYGLDSLLPDPPMTYDVVKVDYPVDLRLVSDCLDTPVDALIALNPSLLRRTTPKDQPFDLHIPEGTRARYEAAMAYIPVEKRTVWRVHTVETGDTLAGIARKYRVTERAIVQTNGLQGGELITDVKLVIPVSGSGINGKIVYSRYPSHYRTHTGDTVTSVAEDFGVPPERLRRWNGLKGNELRHGRVLVIYKPLAPGEPDHAPKRKRTAHKAVAKSKPGTASAASQKESLSAKTQ